MRSVLCVLVGLGVLTAGLALRCGTVSAADEPVKDSVKGSVTGKVFELRIYKANPGKLDAVNARFRDHTCKLFEKHGIAMVGFWIPTDGEETLYYIVSFPSVEAQKKAWEEFRADPEWIKAKADSEKEGVLVEKVTSKNLKAVDYSPIK